MSKEPREFEISRLLELTATEKYATTVAAFEVIEMIDQLDIPKKVQHRKPSIQALTLLADKHIQWDYIEDSAREELEAELRATRKPTSTFDSYFMPAGSAAPMVDDSDEDLDEVVETEPSDVYTEEDEEAGGFDDEEESSSDSDDDEEEEEEEEDSGDNDEDSGADLDFDDEEEELEDDEENE